MLCPWNVYPAHGKVFDNHDFEVRSPENWLSLAQDSEGNTVGLPARALFLQPDLTGAWRECKVQPPLDSMLLLYIGESLIIVRRSVLGRAYVG